MKSGRPEMAICEMSMASPASATRAAMEHEQTLCGSERCATPRRTTLNVEASVVAYRPFEFLGFRSRSMYDPSPATHELWSRARARGDVER